MKIDQETIIESLHGKAPLGSRNTYTGGSIGLGDPDDKTLNELEIKIVVPAWEKDIIIRDYCNNENQVYDACYYNNYFFNRFYTCSAPKQNLNNCIEYWKNRLDLKEQATAEYLEDRRIYRSTGLNKKQREDKVDLKERMATKLVDKLRSFILKDEEKEQYEKNLKSRRG